jgi:hypothetical protein
MGVLGELFGGRRSITLAQAGISVPEQSSVKVTPEVERVKGEELEQAYISDPICFNSINKLVQMIMTAGYSIESSDETATKYFIDFFNRIGNIGENLTFEEILESIFKYQLIYGNAYLELVFNKKDNEIVDIAIIDPKRMDYAKDSSNKIALDKYGKAIGYVLTVPYGYETAGKSDIIPKEYASQVSVPGNGIFILPKRICHFKLYTYGDRFYGLGLIEPAYKSIIRKMNIEEAQANSIYTRGTYPLVAYVGDEQHESTPQDVQTVLNNLVKFKHDRFFAFQHWVKVVPLEVKQSDIVESTLEYLRRNQTASLGLPEPFAVGAGEATNRATLGSQQQFLEYTVNDIVNKTLSTIKKYILQRICFYNGINTIPNIAWNDVGAEEINDKASRLNSYVKNGVLQAQDISNYVKKLEGLK